MTSPDTTETPIDIPKRLEAANLGMLIPRTIAHTLDVALIIGFFMLFQRLTGLGRERSDGLFLLGCLTALSYFLFCEWRWGKTVGKRVLGLAVVDREGKPISFGQSLGRNLLRPFEASIGPICFVGAAFVLFTKDSQRLGDILVDSFVVPTSLLKKPRGGSTK